MLGAPVAATAVPASPSGGCPQPPNALVITEFAIGGADAPRWVELHNPGAAALSLAKVTLVVKPGAVKPAGKVDTVQSFDLGALLQELPSGETVAFGVVPGGATGVGNTLLKTKLIALDADFVLPCAAKLAIDGPSGLVDDVGWNVCGGGGSPIWNLDPSQLDICKNSDLKGWCQPPGDFAKTGTPGKANVACDLDGDGYPSVSSAGAQADCNDLNKQIFPGAVETCNGIDDDCNGQTDEDLVAPPGTCMTKGWCALDPEPGKPVAQCDGAGGFQCHYKAGYESITETQCDGVDNDCDGLTDEGLTNACGSCGSAPAEVCNGVDDDCDGQTDDAIELASPCTGTGVCALAKPQCASGKAICAMPASREVTETLCDGLDNDCDGQTDEELGIGLPCTKGTGACAGAGVRICAPDAKVACTAQERKPAAELCGDALDNNCDGQTDEKFKVGQQCEGGKGVCRVVGKFVCSADRTSDRCSVAPLAPSGAELCANALDDDCDGSTDEQPCQDDDGAPIDCAAGPAAPPAGGWLAAAIAAAVVLALGVRRRAGSWNR